MKSEIQDHAEFLRIRYAQCWEDADILCDALETERGGRHLSIGSVACRIFLPPAPLPSANTFTNLSGTTGVGA